MNLCKVCEGQALALRKTNRLGVKLARDRPSHYEKNEPVGGKDCEGQALALRKSEGKEREGQALALRKNGHGLDYSSSSSA